MALIQMSTVEESIEGLIVSILDGFVKEKKIRMTHFGQIWSSINEMLRRCLYKNSFTNS